MATRDIGGGSRPMPIDRMAVGSNFLYKNKPTTKPAGGKMGKQVRAIKGAIGKGAIGKSPISAIKGAIGKGAIGKSPIKSKNVSTSVRIK